MRLVTIAMRFVTCIVGGIPAWNHGRRIAWFCCVFALKLFDCATLLFKNSYDSEYNMISVTGAGG